MWSETATQIGTLEVRGAPRDDPALRLAISNQLGKADLTSPALPPSAILVVRRFSDPLPQRLVAQGGTIRIDGEWETSARTALSDLFRRASRPAQGLIVGEPEAVIFSDQAELLACLSLDVSQGSAWAHWWWQAILRSMPPSQTRSSGVKTVFCNWARYIPGAFSLLNQWGKILPVVGATTPSDTMAVVQAMADAHGLGSWIAGLQTMLRSSRQNQNDQKKRFPAKSIRETVRENPDGENSLTGMPLAENDDPIFWHRIVGSLVADEDLTRQQAVLLGLGLSLQRAPHLVHLPDFQRAVANWWRGDSDYSNKAVSGVQNLDDRRRQQDQKPLTKPLETMADPTTKAETGSRGREKNDKNGQAEADPGTRNAGTITSPSSRQGSLISGIPPNLVEEQDASSSKEPASPDLIQQPVDRARQSLSSPDLGPEGMRTRLGGVLYLINLMQQLSLPACFEAERPITCRLGSWETLEVLARGLLSDADIELLNDPLWDALARLDNREPGVPPGGGFTRPHQYRLPAGWRDFFPATDKSQLFWALREQHLRIWSELGFVLIDRLEHNNVTTDYLRSALQPYFSSIDSAQILSRSFADAPVYNFNSPWLDGMSCQLLGWLALVMPFIRFQLMTALNLRPDKSSELGKFVFFYPGELHVTASHVDLVMTLETISLPVRMAGLDRNPGWLAEFGRVILFHFN